jgi:hypothetical protein
MPRCQVRFHYFAKCLDFFIGCLLFIHDKRNMKVTIVQAVVVLGLAVRLFVDAKKTADNEGKLPFLI